MNCSVGQNAFCPTVQVIPNVPPRRINATDWRTSPQAEGTANDDASDETKSKNRKTEMLFNHYKRQINKQTSARDTLKHKVTWKIH